METRAIWVKNVRTIMCREQISLSEAAGALGTSKQYLSQLLDPSRELSMREQIMYDLAFLLHTTQSDLFSPGTWEPPTPAIPAAISKQARTILPADGRELLEHITALYEGRDPEAIAACCEAAAPETFEQLTPGERADLDYYWGSALINLQRTTAGEEKIKRALRLFQQRQTHQPETYIPKLIGCYRNLALAAYFDRRFETSIKHNRMIMSKWQDHPAFVDGNEVLNAVTNMLRAAKRGGLHRLIPELESEIRSVAHHNRFSELTERLMLERFSDEAEVADVYQLKLERFPEPHDRQGAELASIARGTYLLVTEQWKELSRHIESSAFRAGHLTRIHRPYWQGRLSIAKGVCGKDLPAALDEMGQIRAMGNVPSRIDVHLDALRAFWQARTGQTDMAVHYWLKAVSGAKAMHLTGFALELTGKMLKQMAGRLSEHDMSLIRHLHDKEKAGYARYILKGEQSNA